MSVCGVSVQSRRTRAACTGHKPFFFKKGTVKKMELASRFAEAKKNGTLNKTLEKRRKKMASKVPRGTSRPAVSQLRTVTCRTIALHSAASACNELARLLTVAFAYSPGTQKNAAGADRAVTVDIIRVTFLKSRCLKLLRFWFAVVLTFCRLTSAEATFCRLTSDEHPPSLRACSELGRAYNTTSRRRI